MASQTSITAQVNKRENARPGEILLQYGLASDALPYLLAATREEPDQWRHYSNLAVAYRFLGRFDDAQASLIEAARLNPGGWQVYHTWANVVEELGEFARARDLRQKSWELCGCTRREVALGLAISLLREGRWEDAWPLWELGRFLYSWTPPPGVRAWQGEPLTGKRLLVLAEGGYGDTFDQSRWLPLVMAQGAAVTLYLWERQIELLRQAPALQGVTFLPISDSFDPRPYDLVTSILSLPAQLGVTPEMVPPPLTFDVLPVSRGSGKRRLGISWRAEENGAPRRTRSIPGRHVEVFQTVDAEWYSLVPNTVLPWMQPGPDNWLETARLIRSLDAVVSVDTAVAHLAGCLGVPVILLLPLNAEWRWLTGRTDCLWYPQHRLVRATKPDEWAESIEEAVRLLSE